MKILGLECSAQAASAAVYEDGRLLCESYVDVKLTHSETLLPMLEAMLKAAALKISDIDCLAVTVGPGSFTGLRIGISAVKGIAFALDIPCIGVSTPEAMAYNLMGQSCTACCVMDARCKQVYAAVFDIEGENVTRILPDEAVAIDVLGENLLKMNCKKPLVLVGDGAVLCYNSFGEKCSAALAPPHLRFQRASGVCALAAQCTENAVTADELAPAYLRLPQAERELLKKEENKT
ncbi:MAG: tRNA (adenosine(37)-N6)-threonylcarbamoyltransferase complex dimerization subunit type 1 TsaB [Hydrogenoanaerobacterium sp.]